MVLLLRDKDLSSALCKEFLNLNDRDVNIRYSLFGPRVNGSRNNSMETRMAPFKQTYQSR